MSPKSKSTSTTPKSIVEIEEFDQANNLVATYIQSDADTGLTEKKSRIDVIIPPNTHSYARSVLNAFLPAGYPHSVTSDYLEYQIYDSLQAFSSSIAGLLSSRAVLEGIGVGNASASPTSALLLSVLQDSMGRIATILFAHRLGTALEPECKMYRLLADVFNDAAMILDCLSPIFPRGVRVGILGGSSVLRSLCGVAAGSSKASLSAHFAKEGNLGELNAKDSSQETVISLMGMLVGTVVVSYIPSTSKLTTWLALLSLLAVHLGTNYLAVRAVCMRTLNRQRANLAFGRIFEDVLLQEAMDELPLPARESKEDDIKGGRGDLKRATTGKEKWPTPEWVRCRERVFEHDGVLRVKGRKIGWCEVGVSMQSIIGSPSRHDLSQLLALFHDTRYIIAFDARRETYLVVLKEHADSKDVIEAWMVVLLTAMWRDAAAIGGAAAAVGGTAGGAGASNVAHSKTTVKTETVSETMERCQAYVKRVSGDLWREMGEAGWDLGIGALETRGGVRVRVRDGE